MRGGSCMDTVSYTLTQCTDCKYRNGCTFLKDINEVAKKLDFLDLSNADCEHYEPEDVIDDKWKEYVEVQEVEVDELKGEFPLINEDDPVMISAESIFDALNEALFSLIASEYIPIEVSMNEETMKLFLPEGENVDKLHSILTDFGAIKVQRDDSIETGFFHVTFVDNAYDEDEEETDYNGE
jgi:hypothetical protein